MKIAMRCWTVPSAIRNGENATSVPGHVMYKATNKSEATNKSKATNRSEATIRNVLIVKLVIKVLQIRADCGITSTPRTLELVL